MSSRFTHHTLALGLLGGMLLSPTAHADYKCDAPQGRLDVAACEAARQGPEVLRQFVQRVRSIESLYFYDYVNEEQATAWRQQEERLEALKKLPATSTLATAPRR